MAKGRISEIFPSIQGEGIYAGFRQFFIRFYGCNLSACRFCDTKPLKYNEYSAHGLLDELLRFKEDYHSISITGGEPLLQKDFLREFLPLPKARGKTIYLETNGTLPDGLDSIIDFTDIIAMDIKLPGSTGLSEFWQIHRIFLEKALAKEVFVKSVITADTTVDDIEKMCDIISGINRNIPLVLQPVTPVGGAEEPAQERLLGFKEMCSSRLRKVSIVPQLHKIIGVK